ncbi:hypothetical protein [Bradyrhizobium sp. RDI18]|uniref:hypothetical protein n=1 Tax=Bradyrhizobium sp. RDI18 TaxID=3367400 RepID=UPI00371FD8A4
MALLLVVHVGARSHRKTGTHFSGSRSNLGCERGHSSNLPQKGSPAKRTGHTLRVAAQYIQKTPKNNGLFGIWLADFGGLNRPFRDRDRPRAKPRQNGPSRLRCSRKTGFAADSGCGSGVDPRRVVAGTIEQVIRSGVGSDDVRFDQREIAVIQDAADY